MSEEEFCPACEQTPCDCVGLDAMIAEIAASDAIGYVATKYGPMNVTVCRLLAGLE